MVKPTDRDVLLLHLLRDEVTCRAAADLLEPQQFSGATERPHRALWQVVRETYLRTSRLPDPTLIRTQVRVVLKDYPDDLAEAEVLLTAASSLPEAALIREEAFRVLEDFLIERKVGSILTQQLSGGEVNRSSLDELIQAREKVRISTVKPFDPMDLSNFGEDLREPALTGVSWLDKPLKGGITPGELYGFLGPSGGGKTTFGVQLACSMAGFRRHAVYLHYEFPIDSNFKMRVYSCITGLPRDRFSVKGLQYMAPEDRRLLQERSDQMAGYQHFVDMSQKDRGFGGVDEIAAVVDQLRRTCPVDLVIADWFGPLVNRYMEQRGIADSDLRKTMNRQIEKAKVLVRSTGIPWFLIHQTSTSAQEKPPTYCPQPTDAAETKAFFFNLDAQFMIGRRDPKTQCHWFTMNKATSRPTMQSVIRFDGERCRFVEDSNYVWDEHAHEFCERGRARDADEFQEYGPDEVVSF